MVGVDDWIAVFCGLVVTVVPGFWVGNLVRRAAKEIAPLTPPSLELAPQWAELTAHNTGGWWIGLLERPLFFAAFWVESGWPIFSTWIAMKTAFYWQSTNFAAFPPSLESRQQADYLVAKHKLGNHRVTTALVGTAANVLLALIGVAVGKWIKLQ